MEEEIRKRLISMADETYKEFHSSLCPGTDNILGIRIPVLRQYAKKLMKENKWKEVLSLEKTEYYEEVMLQGMMIGLSKLTLEETLVHLRNFIPKIDNWAVCDTVCAGLKITKKYPKEMWEFIQSYTKSNEEFEIRFVVVMMLDFYIKEEYIEQVLTILDSIHHEGYYVKMAVAWAISIAYIKFPNKTRSYLKKNHLDNVTYNKAIQKIMESRRVSKEEKETLKKMKRKN